MTDAITPTSWFYDLFTHSENTMDSVFLTLEIVSLLASAATSLVVNIPRYMMITQMFIPSKHDQHDTSKS